MYIFILFVCLPMLALPINTSVFKTPI